MKNMNLWCRFFCIALFIFAGVPSRADQTLTLEDCLTLARERNTRLIQARTARDRARTGITSARASFYPSVSLSSGYQLGDNDSTSTAIGAAYSLFRGGYDRAGISRARAEATLADVNYRLSESDVILTVKEVFFEILQKQDQLSLAGDILKRRNDDLILIRLKYQSGRESGPSVKEAEASLLQAEYDLMAAEKDLDLARTSLNFLLGKPREEKIVLHYCDTAIEYPPLDTILAEAKTHRPEIRSQMTNREIYEAQLRQAKSRYSPELSLSSSYGVQGDSFSDQETDWSTGVSLSWTFFAGLSTKAEVSKFKLFITEEDEKIRELHQQIEEEILRAWNDWQLARKKREVSEKTLEAAREMYQLTKLQYEQGLTSYFFLQQKEDALSRAEYNHINALVSLRTAQAVLQKAWGKDGRSQ